MAMNIEQRLEQSAKSIEQSSQKAHDFAEKDTTIQTCAGSRDSLPKVSRIWQENFARQFSEQDATFQRQINDQATEFQNRFALSQQSLPWQAGITISDSLQRYHVGVQGEEGYKEFLPNPVKLPFETAATLADDLSQERWLENGVPNKHWTEKKVASALEKSLGANARVWPKDRDLQVGDVIPTKEDSPDQLPITHLMVNGNVYLMSQLANGVVTSLTGKTVTIGGDIVRLYDPRPHYIAFDMSDAIANANGHRGVTIRSRANAPFIPATQEEYDSTPDLARFTDRRGGLWVISNKNRVEHDWFIAENETDHVKALQTCFELKSSGIHMTPDRVYDWIEPTYTDEWGNKYWTTPRAGFKIFAYDAEIVTSQIGDVNFAVMSTRFAPEQVKKFKIDDMVIRGANRQAGSKKMVRNCFDAFNVPKTKIKGCTWYGGDFSTLVGCDIQDPKARMDVIDPNVFNVLTIQIDPADTSFFFGHCRNGSITGAVVYQDGVDLAQFCEVHNANWRIKKNIVFGVRTFAFVDHGAYSGQYPQETARAIFSGNIVSCMNSFVTPTDFSQPFRPGGEVSNIQILGNQVTFIPTISGRSELPQGIFAPSNENGNGVETVRDIMIHDNIITFADFGSQLTNCSFLSIQSKYARGISFKGNTVRGWNAGIIKVDVLEGLDWTDNKITLKYGDVSAGDCFSLQLRANTMSDVNFKDNKWGILEATAQRQVILIEFKNASSLSFRDEEISYGQITSYFYQLVTNQQLLNSGLVLENIPLKIGSINFPAISSGQIGVAEMNLFGDGAVINRQVDVYVGNISGGSFPANARIMGKFRLGPNSPLLTAPVYAADGNVDATSLVSMMHVSLNTKPS